MVNVSMLAIVFVIACTTFSAAESVQPSTPKVPIQPKEIQCEVVNWMDFRKAIENANNLISWASDTALVEAIRDNFQTQTITLEKFLPDEINILGNSFLVNSSLGEIILPDISEIQLTPIEALGDTHLNVGVYHRETFVVEFIFEVSYQKKRAQVPGVGWTFCPWEWQFWKECPQHTIEIDATMDVTDLEFTMDVDFQVFKCGGGFWNQIACKFASAWGFVEALLKNRFLDELLERIGYAHVEDVDISFQNSNFFAAATFIKSTEENPDEEFLIEAELSIEEWLTEGLFHSVLFESIGYVLEDAINAGLATITHEFEGSCTRRRM